MTAAYVAFTACVLIATCAFVFSSKMLPLSLLHLTQLKWIDFGVHLLVKLLCFFAALRLLVLAWKWLFSRLLSPEDFAKVQRQLLTDWSEHGA
jgi:Co/Zn/Cd efflux system component